MDRYKLYEHLRLSLDDRVLSVTLAPGRPLNVVTGPLHRELSTIFADIRADRSVDAVLLAGDGGAFCGGADLNWLRDMRATERDVVFEEGRRIVIDMLELPQPIVAAIEGPAVGLGATIALFCDVKFAAENARIGDPHVRIGVVAGDGGCVIWPWLVGAGRAKRYLMTGDLVTANDAKAIGLVDEVCPLGTALAEAGAFAHRLAAGFGPAIRGTKASVNKLLLEAANLVLDTSLALEKESMASDAHRDAVLAFLG
jgi:enoyl-CoA hydratase